jgi:hypothetical protein
MGLAVAGALACGATVAWVRARGYVVSAAVATQLRALSPWHYVVVEAMGRRIVSPASVEVGLFVDRYLADAPRDDRRDLLRFIGYLEHVAPLAVGHGARFTALAPEVQDRVLQGLEASDYSMLRAGFQALKSLALMACYRRDESWEELGYPGPAVRWEQE